MFEDKISVLQALKETNCLTSRAIKNYYSDEALLQPSNPQDELSETIIHEVVRQGDHALTFALIAACPALLTQKFETRTLRESVHKPEKTYIRKQPTVLFAAAAANQTELALALIKSYPELKDQQATYYNVHENPEHETYRHVNRYLHIPYETDFLSHAIDWGCPLTGESKEKNIGFILAIKRKHPDLAENFVIDNIAGNNTLHLAASKGDTVLALALIKDEPHRLYDTNPGIDPSTNKPFVEAEGIIDRVNELGENCLHIAAKKEQMGFVQEIGAFYPRLLSQKNSWTDKKKAEILCRLLNSTKVTDRERQDFLTANSTVFDHAIALENQRIPENQFIAEIGKEGKFKELLSHIFPGSNAGWRYPEQLRSELHHLDDEYPRSPADYFMEANHDKAIYVISLIPDIKDWQRKSHKRWLDKPIEQAKSLANTRLHQGYKMAMLIAARVDGVDELIRDKIDAFLPSGRLNKEKVYFIMNKLNGLDLREASKGFFHHIRHLAIRTALDEGFGKVSEKGFGMLAMFFTDNSLFTSIAEDFTRRRITPTLDNRSLKTVQATVIRHHLDHYDSATYMLLESNRNLAKQLHNTEDTWQKRLGPKSPLTIEVISEKPNKIGREV